MTSGTSGAELGAPSGDSVGRVEADLHSRPREQAAARATDATPAPMSAEDQGDFAWRVHASALDWVARVDSKAWIALTLQIATLGTVATLSAADRVLADLPVWRERLLYVGAGLVLAAAVLAASVVNPHLRTRLLRKTAQEAAERDLGGPPSDLVYFGHLKGLTATRIENGLRALTWEVQLGMMARQLQAVSAIAWRKHWLLRGSLLLWLLGAGLLAGIALTRSW